MSNQARTFFWIIFGFELSDLVVRPERLQIVTFVKVVQTCDELLRELFEVPEYHQHGGHNPWRIHQWGRWLRTWSTASWSCVSLSPILSDCMKARLRAYGRSVQVAMRGRLTGVDGNGRMVWKIERRKCKADRTRLDMKREAPVLPKQPCIRSSNSGNISFCTVIVFR